MNKYKKNLLALSSSFLSMLLLPNSNAFAQMGPDLRPPGLEPDHPINAYKLDDPKNRKDDWRFESSWELNTSDVVFSASKKRQLISEAPSTIHVVTDRDIKAHGWRTLAEILRHVPGVQTMMAQSQFQSVMIRGLVGTENNNSRILWLQNGVPMNDVRDSGVWLDETYPVEFIKRIEVVLGPGSALYGSGAFQGVVNIFTKDPGDIDKYGEYRIALQDNLTFKASAMAAYQSEDGEFGILAHAAANMTNGPGLIGDHVYTNYLMDQAGASVSDGKKPNYFRYENIESQSFKHWYNANLKINYKQLKWNAGYTGVIPNSDGSETVTNIYYDPIDIPSYEGVQMDAFKTYSYGLIRHEFYTDLIYEDNFGDNVTFLTLLSYRYGLYEHKNYGGYTKDNILTQIPILDSNGEWNNSLSSDYVVDVITKQHKIYGLAQTQWRIYEANELIAGLALEYHHISSPDFMNYSNGQLVDNTHNVIITDPYKADVIGYVSPSVFIQDEQRLWNDRIILTGGMRLDFPKANQRVKSNEDPVVPSWRLAFLGKWTDWMTMRLSYGYAYKSPSLYQLYVDTFDNVGNPMLSPEELQNIELSFLFTPTYFLKIRLDTFATLMKNLIIVDFSEDNGTPFEGVFGRYIPIQDSGARILGFELGLDANIGNDWTLYGHYNFLYSKKTENNYTGESLGDIVGDAMHRAKLGFTYMNEYLTADLAMFMVGGDKSSEKTDDGKLQSVPFYAILQPQVTVALPANLGLMFQGSYAFSEGMDSAPTYKFYYEKDGVPVSRYSLMMSLTYPFKK